MSTATMTDQQLNDLRIRAAQRLDALHLDADLIEDASGQTSHEEHLTWLCTASQRDILNWVAGMGE